MIKAVIIDVDGVIVGEKEGYNFPLPHQSVIDRLKQIREKGIPVSLCTAKPYFSVAEIIKAANLHNMHIAMGGAVIIDPIDNVVLEKFVISNNIAKNIAEMFLASNIYLEIATPDQYFVQADQVSQLTEMHTKILRRSPTVVESILDVIPSVEVLKVLPIAKDDAEIKQIEALYEPYNELLELSWAQNPFAGQNKFGNITLKGITKEHAVQKVAEKFSISPNEILGVGDSLADWQFIEHTGYRATLENGTDELKALVLSKGSNSYVGSHVDDLGILEIFDHFEL